MRATMTSIPGRPSGGFTLPELMAVVVVVAILAVVAFPAFMDQVRKSRRAEAIASLNAIAQAQERWRANNPAYTTDLSASGVNVANPGSGYYVLSVTAAASSSFTAVASAAGAQSGDASCTRLGLTLNQGTFTYAASGTATANRCWNR
jgi:type IV pilus assembly protein PilE